MWNILWNRQDTGFPAVDRTTKTTPVMDRWGLTTRRSQQQVAAGEGCDWTDPRPLTGHWLSSPDQVRRLDPLTDGHCQSDELATQQCLCGARQHRTIHRTSRRRDRRRLGLCRRTVSVLQRRQILGRCAFLEDSLAGSPNNAKPIRYKYSTLGLCLIHKYALPSRLTHYRSFQRRFYGSDDPTNSVIVLWSLNWSIPVKWPQYYDTVGWVCPLVVWYGIVEFNVPLDTL